MSEALEFSTDVLVIGGGLAGAWAASAAARAGASVVLVDKGYCGTSGVTAAAGPGHWWVPPDPPEARPGAVAARHKAGFGLGEPRWMARVIEETWNTLPTLAGYYDFPKDDRGLVQYRGLRGPEYMRALRALISDLGVRILDHSPALELLADDSGYIAGAVGIRRQDGNRRWSIRAGAVVLATGGCAFRSHLLGCRTNTGDGLLMAAEAGAVLSGMEFASYYTVAPVHTTMTRSMIYAYADYFDAADRPIEIPPGPDQTRHIAGALLQGPVFARLGRFPEDLRRIMPQVQPNTMTVFDRLGIDPWRERFEITLHGEGTVRGIGGLDIADEDCLTTVPGLFAVGDVATRELVAGATSGGGAQNSAWALSSGRWAGRAAAGLARRRRASRARALGRVALQPRESAKPVDLAAAVATVQRTMLDYERNIFRSGAKLERSRGDLDAVWSEIGNHLAAETADLLEAREVAAMVATARWCVAGALERTESRGMHQRENKPVLSPRLERRLQVGGLDRVWMRFRPSRPLELAS